MIMRFSAAFYESIFTQHGMTVDEIAGKYHVSRQIIIDDLTALGLYNPDSTDSIAEHEREYDHTALGSGMTGDNVSIVPGVPLDFVRIKVGGGIEDSGKNAVDFEVAGAAAAVIVVHEAANDHSLLHSNSNDPTSDEKAALAGSSGTPPTAANPFVDDADTRLSDNRTPTAHNHAGADINSGTIDGDRLPGLSAAKKGGVPATGVASGKFLKDDGTWATPAGSGFTASEVGDSAIVAGNTSVTVAHGCGVKPDWVGVTPGLGFEAPFEVRDGDMDATNFIVRLSGGIVLGANANFKWLAIKI
jgi:hypothetical protein